MKWNKNISGGFKINASFQSDKIVFLLNLIYFYFLLMINKIPIHYSSLAGRNAITGIQMSMN